MTSKNSLVVFMKAPDPGRCKTRLTPPLAPERAAKLYRAFCRDVMDTVGQAGVDVRVAYQPSEGYPTPAWVTDAPFFFQEGSHLGERLIHAFDRLFSEKGGRVVVIGTDTPTLTPDRVREAFERLEENEAVVGPSTDGGYYLVGLSKPRFDIFRDIPWSTDRVMACTLSVLRRTYATTALLPVESDVDTGEDLARLRIRLAGAPESCAPATRRILGRFH